jgi:hypothetical protein
MGFVFLIFKYLKKTKSEIYSFNLLKNHKYKRIKHNLNLTRIFLFLHQYSHRKTFKIKYKSPSFFLFVFALAQSRLFLFSLHETITMSSQFLFKSLSKFSFDSDLRRKYFDSCTTIRFKSLLFSFMYFIRSSIC